MCENCNGLVPPALTPCGYCIPTPINYITISDNTLTLVAADFNSSNVYILTHTGATNIYVPNPTTVTAGLEVRFIVQTSGASIIINPFGSEKLDNQTIPATIPQPEYLSTFVPLHQYGMATNNTNWYSTINF